MCRYIWGGEPGLAEVACPAVLNSLSVSSEATLCAPSVKMDLGPSCDSLCQLPPVRICQERAWESSAGRQGCACWSPRSDLAGFPAVPSCPWHPVAISFSWHPGLWAVLQLSAPMRCSHEQLSPRSRGQILSKSHWCDTTVNFLPPREPWPCPPQQGLGSAWGRGGSSLGAPAWP